MKKIITFSFLLLCITFCPAQSLYKISVDKLKDKIKGGWAGQTIGVTFGGPYEFRFDGTFIQNYQPLVWYDGYVKKTMKDIPGLYDDLYMDLTFVDVMEKYGIDAPTDSFANAFAHAGYMLWHANQAARYNILNGIKPPLSGNWINNPHSEDIDYQIESDYAGLMSPGMPNTASAISNKIGHIMNYGDGWYGGVYVGAMYTLSFVSDDIHYIVKEALKTIPAKSTFYQCINDVLHWHQQYPDDWHRTWFEIQRKWSSDMACPDGIFQPFDIDAKVNAAYVTMGLLYGNGDFGKTLEVATRAGQDADCNPSTAGGILGALLGYEKIPPYFKKGLEGAEDMDFKYTTISLNKVYDISYRHALQNIQKHGGKMENNQIYIKTQHPEPVQLEQGFPKLFPVARKTLDNNDKNELSFTFTGTGFIITGEAVKKEDQKEDYTFEAELYIDGNKTETARLPTNYTTRRHELFWKYPLTKGSHTVLIKILNPNESYVLHCRDYIIFSDQPANRLNN